MIELNSLRWNELSHAYGTADDIPALLKASDDFPSAEDYESEPYYSLWSALCHQGGSYSASIAALPHLIKLCESNPKRVHWSVIQLAICIELSRLEGRCDNDISDVEYQSYTKKLDSVAAQIKHYQPSKDIEIIHRAAIKVVSGDFEAAYIIFMED